MGQPKRHHIVLYLHARLIGNLTSEKLNSQMKLNPEEVEASAWLDVQTIEGIVSACEETAKNLSDTNHIPKQVK